MVVATAAAGVTTSKNTALRVVAMGHIMILQRRQRQIGGKCEEQLVALSLFEER
jgi:hypothetical protein